MAENFDDELRKAVEDQAEKARRFRVVWTDKDGILHKSPNTMTKQSAELWIEQANKSNPEMPHSLEEVAEIFEEGTDNA